MNPLRYKRFIHHGLALPVCVGALVEQVSILQKPGEVPGQFLESRLLTTVNYIFFEYTLPRSLLEKFLKSTLLILLTILLLHRVFSMRLIGIRLRIYTPFHSSRPRTSTSPMPWDIVFIHIFLWIARHIYNHIKLKQKGSTLIENSKPN